MKNKGCAFELKGGGKSRYFSSPEVTGLADFARFLYENRERDIYQKDIEKYFLVGRSTVTNSIQLMEKKGLVRREFVECDARLKKVLLTEKGIQSHETIENMIAEMNSGILEGIDEQDAQVFLKVIRRIRENIEKS